MNREALFQGARKREPDIAIQSWRGRGQSIAESGSGVHMPNGEHRHGQFIVQLMRKILAAHVSPEVLSEFGLFGGVSGESECIECNQESPFLLQAHQHSN